MAIDWKEYIGKRLLITPTWGDKSDEVVVIEVSPSGEFVKFRWPSKSELWSRSEIYRIQEVLADAPKSARQKWLIRLGRIYGK